MIKWNHRTLRVALALAAIASFVVLRRRRSLGRLGTSIYLVLT